MPEETAYDKEVQSALDALEQNLGNFVSAAQGYKIMQSLLDKEGHISAEVIKRILTACVHDMTTKRLHSVFVMKIISSIILKIKMGNYDPAPDLKPSALAVIDLLKMISTLSKVDSLVQLSFRTLSSYPEDILIAVADNHVKIMELLKLYCHMGVLISSRMEALDFLMKLLQKLPHKKKKVFISKGKSFWFSKIIPLVILHQTGECNAEHESLLELLELLTEELVHLDYTDNQHWHSILDSICDKKQYPAKLKDLLNAGNDAWHRLWKVFIKLLKSQVTQTTNKNACPINFILPVVETAFKLDVKSRCKAFECWNVLIDSFSNESNAGNIHKTIKLLIVPLKANNAKSEEVVYAKFNCWWHLFLKFEANIDKVLDKVLLSFLHFCFGNHNIVAKPELLRELFTVNLRRLCNQAVVDIVGHVNCNGCTELPKLKGKIINTKHLVDNWKQWVYILTTTIKIVGCDHGLTPLQIKCMWMSFVTTIAELPDNSIRKDLFANLPLMITYLVQNCSSTNLLDVVVDVLILPLFEDVAEIKSLLKSDNNVITAFVKILLDESLSEHCKNMTTSTLMTKLKTITNLILDEEVCAPKRIICDILSAMPSTDTALLLWVVVAESLSEPLYKKYKIASEVLLWPLKAINSISETKTAAVTWYSTYNMTSANLDNDEFDNKILDILNSTPDDSKSNIYLKLYAVLAILEHKCCIYCSSCEVKLKIENELNMLATLTKNITKYDNYIDIFPILVKTITLVNSVFSKVIELNSPLPIWITINNILYGLTETYKNDISVHVSNWIREILKPLDKMIALDTYRHFLPNNMMDHLLKYFTILIAHLPLQSIIVSILKNLLSNMLSTDRNYKEIISLIADNDKSKLKSEAQDDKILDTNKFSTPNTNEISKSKQKQTSIVKTVVENGEEYVVVKSNWKFNPRKLTENQKEKLQRKREDIPALYQDLSQSQDDLKLVSWKSNSQDNTTSGSLSESKSSKTDKNGSASEILKNLPNTNIVPRILENIISEQNSKISTDKQLLPTSNVIKVESSPTVPKTIKTPRMALKDRVFRNVRNLMEHSGMQKTNVTAFEDTNKTDNDTSQVRNDINSLESIVHSAPPMLSADRPSRLKRKPKKFEDSLLLTCKKTRNDSQDTADVNNSKTSDTSVQLKAENKDKKSLDKNKTNLDISLCDKSMQEIELTIEEQTCKKSANSEPINCDQATNTLSLLQTNEILTLDETRKEDNLTVKKINLGGLNTSAATKESTPKSSKDLREISTPKTSRDKDDQITKTSMVFTASTPKTAEVMTEISPPKSAETVNKEVSPIKTAKNEKEMSIKTCDETTAPFTLKFGKNISTPRDKTTKDSKNTSSDLVCTDIISPTKNITETIQTPTKDNDSVDICKADQPKISSSPDASNDIRETRAKKISQSFNAIMSKSNKVVIGKIEITMDETKSSASKQSKNSKSTVKNSKNRKKKIEKELAIDMVEGHPLLKIPTEKRLTRKTLEAVSTGRRKITTRKLNKSLSDSVGACVNKSDTKKVRRKIISSPSVVVSEKKASEPGNESLLSQDLPNSEDIIESSQDSTVTTISVKASKKALSKIPFVSITKIPIGENDADCLNNSQSLLENATVGPISTNQESNDDIVLPSNKTVLNEKSENVIFLEACDNHTENLDTEPLDAQEVFNEVIIISDDVQDVTTAREDCVIGPGTQELAEADTQPTDPIQLMDITVTQDDTTHIAALSTIKDSCETNICMITNDVQSTEAKDLNNTEINNTLSDTICEDIDKSRASSPFKDEVKRQQDFLSNTIEISPIKTMSPNRDKNSPSPETSNDYVVIKLSSPVHNNGDPFDKFDSPEVFTDDKVSPDKRDQSPPRAEPNISITSPSMSLSLKRNKPQVRSGGRAAQMLGLCVSDMAKPIVSLDKDETEEPKKGSTITPARRNLRNMYNSVTDNIGNANGQSEIEDRTEENFLKFRRSLPAVNSSPSGSILKRKFVEITDDTLISPASKRKRVSFHDPPVSTTISVQKYIEPGVLRSPQNSAHKRAERQLRQHTVLKSPKRLDNVFKLDSVLTKTVESFLENEINSCDETQASSIDETPVVEVIRPSELNNTDPIGPELLECKGSADDAKRSEVMPEKMIIVEEADIIESIADPLSVSECVHAEIQTDSIMFSDISLQTNDIPTTVNSAQTDTIQTAHTSIQTDDSGSKSTADIIKTCLSNRPDFVEQLTKQLTVTEFLAKKSSDDKSNESNSLCDKNEELIRIRDYLCNKYSLIDLMHFMAEVAKVAHDRHK